MSQHPDANQLAAFAERKLLREERGEVLAHLADCADCRETLALASRANGPSSKVSFFPMGWRLASAAAAVALTVAVTWGVRLGLQSPERQIVLNAPAPPPAPASAAAPPARAISAPPPAPAVSASPDTSESRTEPAPQPKKEAVVPKEFIAPAAPQQITGGFVPEESKAKAAAGRTVTPAGAPAADRLLEAPMRFGLQQRATMGVRSRIGWRIHSGALEHSSDGGRSWQAMPVQDGVNFRAVAADGLDVWAGGEDGALFHSSDGGYEWSRVEVREENRSLTGAIVAIRTPLTAEIVLETDSGEQWISRDGGRAWRRL